MYKENWGKHPKKVFPKTTPNLDKSYLKKLKMSKKTIVETWSSFSIYFFPQYPQDPLKEFVFIRLF